METYSICQYLDMEQKQADQVKKLRHCSHYQGRLGTLLPRMIRKHLCKRTLIVCRILNCQFLF